MEGKTVPSTKKAASTLWLKRPFLHQCQTELTSAVKNLRPVLGIAVLSATYWPRGTQRWFSLSQMFPSKSKILDPSQGNEI